MPTEPDIPDFLDRRPKTKAKSWRNMPVHSAADLFPLMTDAELVALGEDIRKNKLTSPIVLWTDDGEKLFLLDGRNRLDAMGAVTIEDAAWWATIVGADGTRTDTCRGDGNVRQRGDTPVGRRG